MLKLYSKACEYAIMALSKIDSADIDRRFTANMLCRQPHIKESYTRKAFQLLSQGGILQAITGPGGGYKFARHPDKISLLEVVHCIDGDECFDHCILGLPDCNDHTGCPMHEKWKPLKAQVLHSLKKITLGEIIKSDEQKQQEMKYVNALPTM